MKRLFLFMAISLVMQIHAQQWVKQSDCGGTIRYETIDFVVNDQAFVVGGLISIGGNFTAYDEVWKYNDTNDTWTQVADYPGGNIYDGISFVIDSIAYVGFGSDESGFRSGQLWAYNSRTDTWTQKKSFGGMERTNAISFALNGKGYVGCGDNYIGQNNRLYLNDFWEYDPQANTWTPLGDFTGGGRVGMTANVVGNKAYVGMGDDGSFFYNTFFEYDPVNDDWIPKASFPGSNRSFYGATAAYDKVYILGGEDVSTGYTNEMWSYDPVADSWQSETDFTGTARVASSLFFLNGSFYYGLGLIGMNSAQGAKDVWKLEISGLSDKEGLSSLASLYPNPANSKLQIDFREADVSGQIDLFNISGQKIRTWDFENLSSVQLELSNIKSGVYQIQIQIGEESHSQKLIIE